jgi:hypothetical protein
VRPLDIPFNVELLVLNKASLAALKPVTSLDTFESLNGNFAENGLFSVSTFGRVGDEQRDLRFSFIDIHTTVMHPAIYKRLVKLKGLYKEILAGRDYAIWDPEQKDFFRSNELEGSTGYAFFMSHWKELEFRENASTVRNQNIELLKKYRDKAMSQYIMVIPAGLRDIETDSSGRTKQSDINDIYRRIVAISRTVAVTQDGDNSAVLNTARHLLQMAWNDVFDFLDQILQGKKGFFQGSWGSRRVMNSTRNVISPMNTSVKVLGGRNAPRFTDTIFGLNQLTKAILPVTIHALRSGYLSQVFNVGDGKARLVDMKTLRSETVKLPSDLYDRYTTVEGIEKVVASYGEIELRDRPILVNGYYLALIYVDDHSNFKVIHGIEDLPEGFNPAFVKPINLCQLLYLSGYRIWNDYCGFVSRYPITGISSCYPTTVYVKTTMVGEMRYELGDDFKRIGEDHLALEFPVFNPRTYLDSQVMPSCRLEGLTADFDGDMCSFVPVYSDEGLNEVRTMLKSRQAWVDPRGYMKASSDVSTVTLVVNNMTG